MPVHKVLIQKAKEMRLSRREKIQNYCLIIYWKMSIAQFKYKFKRKHIVSTIVFESTD